MASPWLAESSTLGCTARPIEAEIMAFANLDHPSQFHKKQQLRTFDFPISIG